MANKLIKYITIEEFEKLLKAEKKKEFKLAYVLGFGSGLRISEIVGLEKEISKCCNANVIQERQMDEEGKKRKPSFCSNCKRKLTEKDKKRLKGSWEIKPLQQDQVLLKEHQIRIFNAKGEKDRVTVTSPGLNETNIKLLPLKIPRRTLQYRLKALAMKVLQKNISFHTLRHGFGNYMVNEKNMPLPMVQIMMGHSRIDTTGIYTKANPVQATNKAWEAWV